MAAKTQTKAQEKKQAPQAKPAETTKDKTETPTAPRFRLGPWPVKAQGGNSIRAYCYNVAKALDKAKAKDGGFTVAELASEFARQADGTDYRQPQGGWGTPEKPNGVAMSHANWFAHEKQGWLTPADKVTEEAKTS